MSNNRLTHFNDQGEAHMVNISQKSETERLAKAVGTISLSQKAYELAKEGGNAKGDVIGIARIAAIMGSKKTAELIPLCHPLSLTHLNADFTFNEADYSITIEVTAKTTGKTGVEMEALTAVSTGLLTIYDMLKAVDKAMVIGDISVIRKEGGKSGDWNRE